MRFERGLGARARQKNGGGSWCPLTLGNTEHRPEGCDPAPPPSYPPPDLTPPPAFHCSRTLTGAPKPAAAFRSQQSPGAGVGGSPPHPPPTMASPLPSRPCLHPTHLSPTAREGPRGPHLDLRTSGQKWVLGAGVVSEGKEPLPGRTGDAGATGQADGGDGGDVTTLTTGPQPLCRLQGPRPTCGGS